MALDSLPQRLRMARARVKLTQAVVAKTLNYTAPTIANWESGRTAPNTTDLVRLAEIYKVTTDWLLARESA